MDDCGKTSQGVRSLIFRGVLIPNKVLKLKRYSRIFKQLLSDVKLNLAN